MNRSMKFKALFLASVMMLNMTAQALACTGIYVGSDVSEDGKAYFGRSEDIGAAYNKRFVIHEGEVHAEGDMFEDVYGFSMPYPAVTYTYSAMEDTTLLGEGERPYAEVGFNENNVSITATVSASPNDVAESFDPLLDTGLCELSLPEVVLMQAESARDGVEKLAAVLDTYGAGEGNIIMIGDGTEVWYMEILTGHQYVAIKMPTDVVAVIPNTFMLGTVDVTSDDVIASPNLVSLAEENGFLVEEDGMINVVATYGVGMASEGNMYRGVLGINKLAGTDFVPELGITYDFMQTPDEKVSLHDIMDVLSYRYEDTPYSADLEENEGIRVIGTPAQAECHIFSYDYTVDTSINGVQWQTMGNSEYTLYLPFYTSVMTETPDSFNVETINYDDESAFWMFRSIATLCALDRELYGAGVKEYYAAYQDALIAAQAEIAPQMEALYLSDPEAATAKANELAQALADETVANLEIIFSELMTYVAKSEAKTYSPFVPSLLTDNVMPTYSFDSVPAAPAETVVVETVEVDEEVVEEVTIEEISVEEFFGDAITLVFNW